MPQDKPECNGVSPLAFDAVAQLRYGLSNQRCVRRVLRSIEPRRADTNSHREDNLRGASINGLATLRPDIVNILSRMGLVFGCVSDDCLVSARMMAAAFYSRGGGFLC